MYTGQLCNIYLSADDLRQLVRVNGIDIVHVELHVKLSRGVGRGVALHGQVHGRKHVLPVGRLAEDGADGYLDLGPDAGRRAAQQQKKEKLVAQEAAAVEALPHAAGLAPRLQINVDVGTGFII